MVGYREAGERGDGRAPEIEVFRHRSPARRVFFGVAAVCALAGVGFAVLAGLRHDVAFAGVATASFVSAGVLAFLASRRFGLLVVSHVPTERTLCIRTDVAGQRETIHRFGATPTVRIEEVHQPNVSSDAPDRPPAYRVRLEGRPRAATIDLLLSRDTARHLQRTLEDAFTLWPPS